MILMALAALLCLTSCSDDDSGIQLTEDEVTGDIITGKQIVINTLTTYTDSGSKVNVNGAKGKVSAISSDDSVAKVSCSSNESEKEIYVSGVSEGNATITVTDSDGNSAILKVEVKNWTARWKIYKTMYVVNRKCLVEGVSSEDSAAIAADAIERVRRHDDQPTALHRVLRCNNGALPVSGVCRVYSLGHVLPSPLLGNSALFSSSRV